MSTKAKSKRSASGAAARGSPQPGASNTVASNRELKWVKQLPLRLKGYANWMNQFLHGGK